MAVAEFDELNILEAEADKFVDNISTVIDDPNRSMIQGDIEDDLEDLLIMAYALGSDYARRVLGTDTEASAEEVREAVYRKIDDEDFKQLIRKHIEEGDLGMIKTVIRTETGRVYNEAVMDISEDSGLDGIKKTWVTMGDAKVRDPHWALEGVTIPYKDEFYVGEDHAFQPCGFGVPELDCNCRCRLRISK